MKWSTRIQTGFHVSRSTWELIRSSHTFKYEAITRYGQASQPVFLIWKFVTSRTAVRQFQLVPQPHSNSGWHLLTSLWFRLLRVRSPLLTDSLLVSFPQGTKMFQFPCLPPYGYAFTIQYYDMTHSGFPHSEIFGSKRIAAPRSLSQLIASFIGFTHLGILHVPLIFSSWATFALLTYY